MQELWLYGVIEDDFGGVRSLDVRDELAKLNKREPLLVRINSPGGSFFEAVAIYTQLQQWPGGVDVQVDGLAASAASYLSTVGNTVTMALGSMLMIHDAWGVTIGNAEDHHDAGDVLNTISNTLTAAYALKCGKSHAEFREAMKSELWLTAEGAVAYGLADYSLDAEGKRAVSSRARVASKFAAYRRQLDEMRLA